MTTPRVVLTVAGTDSGGAAGIAADLTTFAALGVHGSCAVTAVTAQDTTGVAGIVRLSAEQVLDQINAVLGDLPVSAIKTGMLGDSDIATAVAGLDLRIPVVVDPVLAATSGVSLADKSLVTAYLDHVLPWATVVTPNLAEARILTGAGADDPSEDIALALHAMGPAVVLTGGDSPGQWCRDLLIDARGNVHHLDHAAIPTANDHGTGCTFSAALAVGLASRQPLISAVRDAQAFVAAALHTSQSWQLGRGRGPVAHILNQPQKEK